MKTLKFDLAFEVAWSASCDVFFRINGIWTKDYGLRNEKPLVSGRGLSVGLVQLYFKVIGSDK